MLSAVVGAVLASLLLPLLLAAVVRSWCMCRGLSDCLLATELRVPKPSAPSHAAT